MESDLTGSSLPKIRSPKFMSQQKRLCYAPSMMYCMVTGVVTDFSIRLSDMFEY